MRAATATSAMVLLGTLLLIAFRPQFSLAPDFHVRAGPSIFFTELSFFNDLDCGPYCGGTLTLSNDDGTSALDVEYGFDIPLVIYYRYFEWQGYTLWTLTLNLWCVAAPSSVLPGIWLWRRVWKWRRQPVARV